MDTEQVGEVHSIYYPMHGWCLRERNIIISSSGNLHSHQALYSHLGTDIIFREGGEKGIHTNLKATTYAGSARPWEVRAWVMQAK